MKKQKMNWNISKSFTVIIILALPLILVPSTEAFGDDDLTVKVGLYEDAPKIFTNTEGNPSGFWADILEYIASKEGWSIEWVSGTWPQCEKRLRNGEIDIMPDVGYTEKRAERFAFQEEVTLVSWSRVYVPEGSQIESIPDLNDKNIAMLRGSVNYTGPGGIKDLVESFHINCNFVEAADYNEVFELLKKAEVDAGVVNKNFGAKYEEEYNVDRTSIVFQPSDLKFAFPKDGSLTPHLIERIDYHIKKLQDNKDSIYYTSQEKYLGLEVGKKLVFPVWGQWALVATGSLLILFVGGFVVLRRANQKLRRANERLNEVDRLKSMFVASMSHELRTPLNSIIGFTGVLLQGLVGELNEEQKKQLKMVKSSSQHLLALVNDVIDISKIEAGKTKVQVEEFDLAEVIEEVKETFSVTARDENIHFQVDGPEELIMRSDRRRVKQVVMNFTSNAFKYTQEGEVTIIYKQKERMAEISVTDTGSGIPDSEMDKLFKAFSQVDQKNRAKEGTGLGLYLSRKIAHMLGGTVTAESELGKGSTFTFRVPLQYEEGTNNE